MSGELSLKSAIGKWLDALLRETAGDETPPTPALAKTNLPAEWQTAVAWYRQGKEDDLLGPRLLHRFLGIRLPSKVEISCDAYREAVSESRRAQNLTPLLNFFISDDMGIYVDPDQGTRRRNPRPEARDIGVQGAWKIPYAENAHKILLENIQKSYKRLVPYANTGAIIQSSGYGKSRTVDQLATLIPTIPMNVRNPEDSKQAAFPLPDHPLTELFEEFPTLFSKDPYAVAGFHCFFKLVFDGVAQEVDHLKKSDSASLAESLRNRLQAQEVRDDLYDSVKQKLKAEVGNINTVEACNLWTSEAQKSLRELLEKLGQTPGPVSLVMYIDEAHTLARKGSKDDTRSGTLYDLMIKAAADFSATPAEFINSARAQQGKSTLVPPFTELPFDCHPELKKMIRPGLKLEEIQAFSFIVRFGRPIFWTLYEAIIRDDVDSRTAEDRVRSLAAMKLVAHETTERRHSSIAILAILDMLLNLHYDPRRISTHRVGNTLVASHMRTAFSVPADRFSMYSGYPSEPVLAEAALDVLYLNHKKRNPDSLTNYFESLDEDHLGAIDKGERGENVGKLILLSAYIAAVVEDAKKSGALTENRDGIEREVTPNWRNGCSVSSFLKHLAADQFHSVILECRPDNGSGLALEDAFNKAWVRFTHFVRAGDDSSMTTSVAWGAFVRGMAIIGWHSQPIVDVHIPVLLDKDAPIGEANMSGILVQFKTREVPTPQPKVAIKAEALSYFPPAGSRRDPFRHADADPSSKLSHQTRPYISLVMELGVLSARQAPVRRKIVKILDKLPIVEKPGSKLKAAGSLSKVSTSAPVQSEDNSKEPVHPRYSLFFYGRSHKVYRCLRHSEEVYAKLLQVGGLLEAHSSQRPLKPVLRMKPFWCAGEESFGWLDEPYVKPEDLIVPVPMEMVRAGSDDMDVDEESGPRADPDIEMVQD